MRMIKAIPTPVGAHPVGDRRAPRLDGSGRSQGELLHRASTSHDDAHSAVGHCNGNTLLAPEICDRAREARDRSEEHTSELQSLMRISYAVFCLKKQTPKHKRLHSKHS